MDPCINPPSAARKRIGWWGSMPPAFSPFSNQWNHQQRPPWGGIGERPGRSAQDHAEEKALHPGAAGGRKTGMWVAESPGQSCPPRRSPRSWATYEPEQEMAFGMVVLPERKRQTPV